MRYVKAAVVGLVIAVVGGAMAGIRQYFILKEVADASARARVYAESIAVALNCAALFALLCLPVALLVQVVRGIIAGRRRGSPG